MPNKQKPQKYIDITLAAKELFWDHGFRKVSMEEICREAKVSKMTLYKYFGNKSELALEVIKNQFEPYKQITSELLLNKEISFEHKIAISIKLKKDATGSISKALHKDIGEQIVPEVTAYFGTYYQESMKDLARFFETSKKEGHIRKSISLSLMSTFAEATQSIASNQHVVDDYSNLTDLSVELLKLMMYGISPNEKEYNHNEVLIEEEYQQLLTKYKSK